MATRDVQAAKKGSARPLLTLVRGDSRTQIIRLIVDRYSGGVDLSGLAWDVVATNAANESDIYYIADAQVEDTVVVCDWVVRGIATSVEGETRFELEGFDRDADGETVYTWQSGIYSINVTADLNYTPSEDEEAELSGVQELILTVTKELPTVYKARDAANQAAQEAGAATEKANAAAETATEAAKDAPIMITMSADCASIDGEITITDVSMPPTEIQKTFGSGKHFRAALTISINGSSFNKYMGYVDLCQGFMVIGSNPKNLLQWTGAVNRVSSSGVSNESYRVAVDLNIVDSPIGGTIKAFRIANNADVEGVKTSLSNAETNIKGIDARVKKIEEEGAGGGACGCEYATDEEILAMMLEMDALPTLVDADGDVLIGADNTILLI